jgi:hypothetical protein
MLNVLCMFYILLEPFRVRLFHMIDIHCDLEPIKAFCMQID